MEGSIKDIGNVLGSMSHSSSDLMCTARLAMMTSVRRGGTSTCCFDFEANKDYRKDWLESAKNKDEASKVMADPEDAEECDSVSDDD